MHCPKSHCTPRHSHWRVKRSVLTSTQCLTSNTLRKTSVHEWQIGVFGTAGNLHKYLCFCSCHHGNCHHGSCHHGSYTYFTSWLHFCFSSLLPPPPPSHTHTHTHTHTISVRCLVYDLVHTFVPHLSTQSLNGLFDFVSPRLDVGAYVVTGIDMCNVPQLRNCFHLQHHSHFLSSSFPPSPPSLSVRTSWYKRRPTMSWSTYSLPTVPLTKRLERSILNSWKSHYSSPSQPHTPLLRRYI